MISLPKLPLDPHDRAWVDALRRYGDHNGFVQIYRNLDGSLNVQTTVDRLMEMHEIKPRS